MKRAFIFAFIFCFYFASFATPKTSPTLSSGLKTISNYKNYAVFIRVLQTEMSKTDSNYVSDEFKKLGGKIDGKINLRILPNDGFTIGRNKNPFHFRLNGNEITYRGHSLRFNKNSSLQKNVEEFNKRLSVVSTDIWLPHANAQNDVSQEAWEVQHSGLVAAMALDHMKKYMQNGSFTANAEEIAADSQLQDFLMADYMRPVKGINCQYEKRLDIASDGTKADSLGDPTIMIVAHQDGGELRLVRKLGTSGEESVLYAQETGGRLPANLPMEDLAPLYKKTISAVALKVCSMPRSQRDTLINKLNELRGFKHQEAPADPAESTDMVQ